MAKATLIDAVVDAELRAADRSLASCLGGDKRAVACGVSIGIADTTDELRALVDEHLEQGYRRIKLKIMPGVDVERVAAIRRGPSRHRAVGRRERGVHGRKTSTCSVRSTSSTC